VPASVGSLLTVKLEVSEFDATDGCHHTKHGKVTFVDLAGAWRSVSCGVSAHGA
jgi:hypothetical protein